MSSVIRFYFQVFCFIVQGHSAFSLLLNRILLQGLASGVFCDNVPGLTTKQRALCKEYPETMSNVGLGLQLAIDECQHQFMYHKWNCSLTNFSKDYILLSNFMERGSREAAFIQTITSAGVTYAVAKGCSQGTQTNCACVPNKDSSPNRDSGGEFEWTGCTDNIDFGVSFARQFLEAKESSTRDARGLMNLHNNNAGRRGIKGRVQQKCKCHGVSGSCNLKTCWKAMQDFSSVGDYLKEKYETAVMVGMGQDGTGLSVVHRKKKLGRSDIVYMELSPDYCVFNPTVGSYGTENRVCNKNSTGPDGCDSLCCGRGYDTKTVQESVNCACKFQWCCTVKCKLCDIVKDEYTCKQAEPSRV